MNKPKLKIGDKVRVLDGSKICGYAGNWVNSMAEACEGLSIFGNYLIALSDEDIEQLKQGKILFISDEYSICVACKNK